MVAVGHLDNSGYSALLIELLSSSGLPLASAFLAMEGVVTDAGDSYKDVTEEAPYSHP